MCSGPRLSQIAWTAAHVVDGGEPVVQRLNPIPAFAAWRLSGRTAALLRRSPLRTGRAALTASRLKQSLWARVQFCGAGPLPRRR